MNQRQFSDCAKFERDFPKSHIPVAVTSPSHVMDLKPLEKLGHERVAKKVA